MHVLYRMTYGEEDAKNRKLDRSLVRRVGTDGDTPIRASFASTLWYEWITAHLRNFCTQLAATPEGAGLFSIQLANGLYGEWHQFGFLHHDPDTGVAATKSYRAWLRARYGADDKLAAAWNRPDVRLDTVIPPGTPEREHADGATVSVVIPTWKRPEDLTRCLRALAAQTFWDNRDWDWYKANIPFFECPDADMVTTYYYRWELITKHLTYGSPNSGYSFTEFTDRPFWSGAYGAISCPVGHHLYEIRWLADPVSVLSRWFIKVPSKACRMSCKSSRDFMSNLPSAIALSNHPVAAATSVFAHLANASVRKTPTPCRSPMRSAKRLKAMAGSNAINFSMIMHSNR